MKVKKLNNKLTRRTVLWGIFTTPIVSKFKLNKFTNHNIISYVRRYNPTLMSQYIIGVQPMSGPSGLVFALRPVYNQEQYFGS